MSSGRSGVYLEGKQAGDVPITAVLGDSILPIPPLALDPVGLVAAANADDDTHDIYVYDRVKDFGGNPIFTQRLLDPVGKLSSVPPVGPSTTTLYDLLVIGSTGTAVIRADQGNRMYYIQRSNGTFRARLTQYIDFTANAPGHHRIGVSVLATEVAPLGWEFREDDITIPDTPNGMVNITVDPASFNGAAQGGISLLSTTTVSFAFAHQAFIYCGTTNTYTYRYDFDIPIVPKNRPVA